MNGTFTISLDFELHWGGFEKWPLENYKTYFQSTRKVIPEMLSLFRKHEVHVTWATVGMLFHENKQELLKNCPLNKPGYEIKELSAYNYIESNGIGSNENDDPFHYAPSLIRQIIAVPFQEIGTHTFAHYYCNEAGQTVEQFQDDLKAAKRVASTYGVELRSLVFPRNQFNNQYLKACFIEGITSVRSNPLDWFWNIESTQSESMWKRLNRGADAYFPIGEMNTYSLNSIAVKHGYPLCIPASRLLRPYNPKEFFLNDLKISRIKNEMSRAAQRGEVYHLWWHPHNFGNYPEQSVEGLQRILEHYAYCRKTWDMKSCTMGELTATRLHER
jgi:peptidoglycan/xylan/chitin deacetylase (PgdA/CDA1 family)